MNKMPRFIVGAVVFAITLFILRILFDETISFVQVFMVLLAVCIANIVELLMSND